MKYLAAIATWLLCLSAFASDLTRDLAWDEDPSYANPESRPDYYELRCGVDAPGTTPITVQYGTNTASCDVSYDPSGPHTLMVDARACRNGDFDPELKCSPDASISMALPQGLMPPINIRVEVQGVISLNADDLRAAFAALGR